MSPLEPFHLPGSGSLPAELPLDGLPGRVPQPSVEQVEGIWNALQTAAVAWRVGPLEARLCRLAEVAMALRRGGPGAWRELLSRSTGLSPAGLDAAWDVTFAPYDAASLRAALDAEALSASRLAALEAEERLPRRIVHVLAGNVLPSSFAMLVRGWMLGAAQWLRPAASEPYFAPCIVQRLGELAPELAAATAVLWWPHEGSRSGEAIVARAQVVTVQGDDVAVEAVQEQVRRVSPGCRSVGYGARWSAALVSARSQTPAAAQALARDVALFDQRGCLSPSLVLAERGPRLQAWCGELAASLQDLESRQPRGHLPAETRAALRHWHESQRLAHAFGTTHGFWEGTGTAWGVALLDACRDEPSPLARHVVVAPFEELEEIDVALHDALPRLQGLALNLDGWSEARAATILERLRPTHSAPLGTLQQAPPSWRQDHRAPLGSLCL